MNKYLTQLNTICDAQIDKYQYLLARYMNDVSVDLRSQWEYSPFIYQGFDVRQDSDLMKSAYTNVIKSAIDSITSKLANQKVRPYFNPVNGTWKTDQIVKNAQQYFDILFDKENVHGVVSDAFRNACIFGIGYIYINPLTYTIKALQPHCIALLNSETKYGINTKMMVRYLNFPVEQVEEYCGKKVDKNTQYCNLRHFIDTKAHKQEVYIDNKLILTEKYDSDVLPFVPVYFNKPVFGLNTTSIVQDLDGIQTQIDIINAKISACTQLNPGNTTYVIEGSNLTPGDIDNRVGHVYGVKMPPGTSAPPVVNIAPAVCDPQLMTMLQYYVKQAYEIVGISELSAMSKKPSGIESGTALQTMEDIESDRFETQVTHYVTSYVDLAKLLIEILPDDMDILPQSINTSTLKWKDLKKQSNLFKVQYSAASSLSKDPSEKMKQIAQLNQIQQIGADKISKYLDMPDLEDAYRGASAVADGVMQCIQRAIEYEDYGIPDFVNYQNLAQQIAIIENELYAAIGDDKKNNEEVEQSLFRLMTLEEHLATKLEEQGFVDLTEDNTADENGNPKPTETGLVAGNGTNKAADITSTIQDNETISPEVEDEEQLANPNNPAVQ